MSSLRYPLMLLLALMFMTGTAFASEINYHYISATDLESRLTANTSTNIVDIQVEEEFSRHHIQGAIPTHAYPVKSDGDRAKLDAVVAQLQTNDDPVIIVCPRGAGGAKRTYDYLLEQGVADDRLLILEKGQSDWPYATVDGSK